MPAAMISFLDGEVLHADVDDLTFDAPVLEARVRTIGSNNDHALLPLGAIRQVLVGSVHTAPEEAVLAGWERAAFRFLDGQVIRARIAPGPMLGRHGGVWQCVEPGTVELRTLAIPYTALKAVFELHHWDGRPIAERSADRADSPAQGDRLARILTERADPGQATDGGDAGLLKRVLRAERRR